MDEVNFRKEYGWQIMVDVANWPLLRKVGNIKGASQIYESILHTGKDKQICKACNRPLEIDELDEFEKYVNLTFSVPAKETYLFCLVERSYPEIQGWSVQWRVWYERKTLKRMGRGAGKTAGTSPQASVDESDKSEGYPRTKRTNQEARGNASWTWQGGWRGKPSH